MSMSARLLLLAQVCFFAGLAVCAALDPRGLQSNHGWSYYGGRSETLVPYLAGFLGCVVLLLVAASHVERSSAPAGLASGLRLLVVFLLLDVATPDTVDAVLYWAHDLTSALLFLYELGFAAWIVAYAIQGRAGVALVLVQLAGGILAMLSQLQLIPLLGLGILLFQASFGALLVVATRGLVEREAPVGVGAI